jgi:hypothetical protein
MAGVLSERQETGVVDAINSYYSKFGKPISVTAGSISLRNVVSAEKYGGRSSAGTEPYTDVIIRTKNKAYNISNKGTSAPSIAGGGLKGLELIIPGFSGRFLNAALKKYLELGYKDGDNIPDMYGKVGDELKELIVVGNVSMGGPIDYMYIGPMDVHSSGNGSVLRLNGNFYDAKKYAATHDLYLRLRKRRNDQPFDSKTTDKQGYPLILGKSPTAGDSGRRVVIVPRPPSNAITVEF